MPQRDCYHCTLYSLPPHLIMNLRHRKMIYSSQPSRKSQQTTAGANLREQRSIMYSTCCSYTMQQSFTVNKTSSFPKEWPCKHAGRKKHIVKTRSGAEIKIYIYFYSISKMPSKVPCKVYGFNKQLLVNNWVEIL